MMPIVAMPRKDLFCADLKSITRTGKRGQNHLHDEPLLMIVPKGANHHGILAIGRFESTSTLAYISVL
jgi:hypothetical protein